MADDCVMCPPGKYQPQPASVGPAAAAGETVLVAAAAAGAALLCLACPGEGLHVPSTSVVAALSSFFSFSSLSPSLSKDKPAEGGGLHVPWSRPERERERVHGAEPRFRRIEARCLLAALISPARVRP